jgi:DNA polymerase III subunit epsilon
VVVSHNWPFDAMHLRAEFERMGLDSPFHSAAGLCTMRAARLALPTSGRALIDCCAAMGLRGMRWHTARDDAMAAAALLRRLLARYPRTVRLTAEQLKTASCMRP